MAATTHITVTTTRSQPRATSKITTPATVPMESATVCRQSTAVVTFTLNMFRPWLLRSIRTTITVGQFIRTITGTQGTTSLGTTKWHEHSSVQAKNGWILDVSPSFEIDGWPINVATAE